MNDSKTNLPLQVYFIRCIVVNMERKFFGVKLDPSIWKAAKSAALAADKTMWQFIEEAILRHIPAQYRPEAKKAKAAKP